MSNFLSKDLGEHRNRYQQDVAEIQLVSKKEQHELWLKAMDGDEDAWHTLWLQGVRMVNKLVKKFIQLGRILPGDEMDAIQEGNLAIGLALPNWSPNRGAYSTFIWVCIRGALIDFNDKESRGGLTGQFDFDEVVHDALELRTPSENEGSSTKVKLITDWYGVTHDMDVDMLALTMDYDKILEGIEREILDKLYYQDKTLEEIGAELNWSRQTVAKYRDEAVNKLRLAYDKMI